MNWGRPDRRNMLFQALWLYREWWRLYLLLVLTIGTQVLFASESRAFSLSPSQLTFTATAGAGAPASQTLSLSAPTSGEWFGEAEASWVKLPGNYGSLSGGSAQLSVSVNTSGMTAGIYSTTVHFWASGGGDSNVYYNAMTVTLNLTTGSGGGSGGGTGPSIALSPTSLSFSGVAGGSNPPSKTVSLTNPGGSTLSTTWTSSDGWLVLSRSSHSTRTETDSVSVTARTSGLGAGTYQGTITVSGNASNSPQQIPVTLTLTQPSGGGGSTPALSVSPTSLTFNVPAWSLDMATQYINISNTAGGTLNWTVTDPVNWLYKDVDSGSGNYALKIDVFPEYFGGAPGTYTTNVTISASGASGSPKTIPVTLNIGSTSGGGGGGSGGGSTSPVLSVSPSSLTFNLPEWSWDPATQYINISNTGGGTLTWTASDPVDWLIKDVNGATGNYALKIDVYPGSFGGTPGTYTTNVTISASGASGSPKTIPVTMNIGGSGGGGGGGTASVTLTWNANSESDLQGYRVYYGTSSRNYTTNTDVGNVTSYTVSGLATGATYYFAITALDTSGNESGFSGEVSASR